MEVGGDPAGEESNPVGGDLLWATRHTEITHDALYE
jgi:hypothetical protein